MNPFELDPEVLSGLIARLTPRQMEIVGLLAEGRSKKHIATLLSISRETVKRHVYRSCQKMGLDNWAQLIVIYAMWEVTKNSAE